jgi:hypothetical protein
MAYTTIDDPSVYFQTKIYSGDGNDDRNITYDGNSDMQPDWLWFKRRNQDVNHILFDSTRGVTKRNHSNNANAEATEANFLQAFQSNGFQVGTDADINGSGGTYVSWGWKANGGSRTTFTESGNNPGGGYQANTTAGFSIVDYTGTANAGTVSHGLGVVPHVMIFKNRDQADDWGVYHHKNTAAPETDFLKLNTTDATADSVNVFNDTAPTSSVFTVNIAGTVNEDAEKYIAYCFAPIQGYSKFGSYTGNGNNDGAFVYTGFKPAWVMIKCTSEGSRNWVIYDNKRETFNEQEYFIRANNSGAEQRDDGYSEIDLLSNGFKLRGASGDTNKSSATFVYMAFAEHPFVSSEGVPTTAR